ncbi:MAG TPA: TetR family transcriptional regulator [Sphingobium sp.]|nr:TetR family transcriptional regulator [Sphingobium sp.]
MSMVEKHKPARRRLSADQSRTLILEAAERVLLTQGYPALSIRRVATEAGMKTPLIHYHFETTEDLLIALYRHVGEKHRRNIQAALASDRPLHALWDVNTGGDSGRLIAEMVGLGHRNEAVRAELAAHVEEFRAMQARAFDTALRARPATAGCTPEAAIFILTAVTSALVMDRGVGITAGHDDSIAFVKACIDRLEP